MCVLIFPTSPNSGVELLGGFLRSEKTTFQFIFVGCASLSLFFFSAAMARDGLCRDRHNLDDATPAAQEAWGEHAIVKLELTEGEEPRAAKPIRAVELREIMLQQKLKDFESRGFFIEAKANPQWVSRCFLVPKRESSKLRLVIDYRWLNSQLKAKRFPIPIIEDQLANQSGNCLFTLIDLEDGFEQMHLEEGSKHLTAFCTPFGVIEWNVLPMGGQSGTGSVPGNGTARHQEMPLLPLIHRRYSFGK